MTLLLTMELNSLRVDFSQVLNARIKWRLNTIFNRLLKVLVVLLVSKVQQQSLLVSLILLFQFDSLIHSFNIHRLFLVSFGSIDKTW